MYMYGYFKILLLSTFIVIPQMSVFGNEYLDSLKHELPYVTVDTARIEMLYEIGYDYIFESLDSAFLYGLMCFQEGQKCKSVRHRTLGYQVMSLIYLYRSVFDTAEIYLRSGLEYVMEKDLKLASALYTNLGLLYKRQGVYDLAIQAYFEGIEVDEKTNNDYGKLIKLANIGNTYASLLNLEKAMEYDKIALDFTFSMEDHSRISYIRGLLLNNIATVWMEMSQFDSAVPYLEKALDINQVDENQGEISRNLHNLGATYEKLDKPKTALPYLREALTIRKTLGDKLGLIETHMELGNTFSKLPDLDSMEFHLGLALMYAEELDNLPFLSETNLAFSDAYSNLNMSSKAFEHYKQYVLYQDSLDNKNNTAQINELEIKYQTALKESKIKEQDKIILRQRGNRNRLLSLLTLVCLISFFIWYRQNAETKLKLAKIESLEKQQKLISLDFMVQGQEEERKRVAQELHDGLGGLLFSAKAQLKKIQREIDKLGNLNILGEAEELINHATNEVRRISHDMMPAALANLGITDTIEDLGMAIANDHHIAVELHCNIDVDDLTDIQSINVYRIVQEITNNTLKYADANELQIRLSRQDQNIMLFVSDNGNGFNLEAVKLKDGIGLKNIKSRVDYLNGNLSIDTAEGEGCSYSIIFPMD